jgi:two-component system cell cycle sensor histidine kinase/response regulator CckA
MVEPMSLTSFAVENAAALRDVWAVYETRREAVRTAVLAVAKDHPVFGETLTDLLSVQPQRLLARAVESGVWAEWTAALQVHAKTREAVPLSSFCEVVRAVDGVMVPALVTAYGAEPERLSGALRAMRGFVDLAVTPLVEPGEMTDAFRRMNEELEKRVAERTAELERSEEQLRHAQKMEAVGRLAGGIAHDFNNLLSVILSYGEMMSAELPKDDELHDDLSEIRRAAHRAADLTRQLLAFSRQQVLAPRVVDLNQVVTGMDKMVVRLIGEDVEVRTVAAPDLAPVMVDPGQIEQVLMNLVVNARDAMPDGGMLTIETRNVVLDEAYAEQHDGVKPGAHAMIAVTDTGVGMDKATLGRIFEPFFTTKGAGKGTGLGLSTAFGIVKQSGGHIWVYSEVGRGTTFKIYFPRATLDARHTTSTLPAASPRGHETVLLVEDEEQVRTLVRAILVRHGYSVLVADAGPSAMKLAESYAEPIHLLLTDLVMPKMNGRELAERLAPRRPEMKVLFMSGYTDDTVVRHGVLDSGVAFLQKPITPDALARKVRDVLDAP